MNNFPRFPRDEIYRDIFARLQNLSFTDLGDVNIDPANLTQGDIFYYDGSDIVRLPPGTSGEFLQTQGSGADPVWNTPSGGQTSIESIGAQRLDTYNDLSADKGEYVPIKAHDTESFSTVPTGSYIEWQMARDNGFDPGETGWSWCEAQTTVPFGLSEIKFYFYYEDNDSANSSNEIFIAVNDGSNEASTTFTPSANANRYQSESMTSFGSVDVSSSSNLLITAGMDVAAGGSGSTIFHINRIELIG